MSDEPSELEVLNRRWDKLQAEASKVGKQIREARLRQARRTYTCECVQLGSDLRIYDMAALACSGRVGLELGLIAETLLAIADCKVCGGTGIPKAGGR